MPPSRARRSTTSARISRSTRSRLAAVADRVAALTLRRFPDLRIPYHSRWRHFEAGGVDRKAELDALLAGRPTAEVARARFDLTVVSVLLDAGAGARWRTPKGRTSALPRCRCSATAATSCWRCWIRPRRGPWPCPPAAGL